MTESPSSREDQRITGTSHNRLAGKRALVTGSTRGLGRTTAEWLAREGASVFVHGRKQDDVDRTIGELRELGVEVWGAPADLSSVEATHKLATTALETAGSFDILVNNAGMSIGQHFTEVSDDQWDEQVNTNMRAPFILSQHLSRAMIANGIRGRIVNISTVGVYAAHKRTMVYDMAKGGIQAMTRPWPTSSASMASTPTASRQALWSIVREPEWKKANLPPRVSGMKRSRPVGWDARRISPRRSSSSACPRPNGSPGRRCSWTVVISRT